MDGIQQNYLLKTLFYPYLLNLDSPFLFWGFSVILFAIWNWEKKYDMVKQKLFLLFA